MYKPRRKLPEWKKRVDLDLEEYKKLEILEIKSQLAIEGIRLAGQKTTPTYILREGSHGGPTRFQVEELTLKILQHEQTIEYCQSYRKHIEESVEYLFGADEEKLKFIERYWWTTGNKHISTRTKLVMRVMPFLSYGNVGERPNSTFFKWREEIYKKIADLFGYR